MTAIAVTIAGSDSSGGAGIQADLKTFSALGVYGASVMTALTAQNTQGVSAIHAVPPDFVRSQIDAVLDDLAVDAVKIGMLADGGVIEAVSEGLSAHRSIPIVLDPVMVATSGDVLLEKEAMAVLKQTLLRQANIITPNLYEAALITGEAPAENDADIIRQATVILAMGVKSVLLKGGHGGDHETVRDFFTDGREEFWLSSPRYVTSNTHGTGCTLSSAIASGIAKGMSLRQALEDAKTYVSQAIAAADSLDVGKGHGPTHHFFSFWKA